jgi:hypothetical protein
MSQKSDRRRFLKTGLAGIAVWTAGCSASEEDTAEQIKKKTSTTAETSLSPTRQSRTRHTSAVSVISSATNRETRSETTQETGIRPPNYVEITKEPDSVEYSEVEYRFTVTGELMSGPEAENGEIVNSTTAKGRMGPKRGTDDFYFSGEIRNFNLDGDAVIYLNGNQRDPTELAETTAGEEEESTEKSTTATATTEPPTESTTTSTTTPSMTTTATTTTTPIKERETNNSASTDLGRLPIKKVQAKPARAETRGISGEGERKNITTRESEAKDSGFSSFSLDGMIDGTGTLAMNAGALFIAPWRAPETGEYSVSATYWGHGGYEYDPASNDDRDYTVCSEVNLAAIQDRDRVVEEHTEPTFRVGNNGLKEEAAEQLLEFLATRLITPYLGVIGSFIAKRVIDWAIELNFREPSEDSFFIENTDPNQIEITFFANEGEIYNIQFTPSIGFVGKSYVDWILISKVISTYYLDALEIRKI